MATNEPVSAVPAETICPVGGTSVTPTIFVPDIGMYPDEADGVPTIEPRESNPKCQPDGAKRSKSQPCGPLPSLYIVTLNEVSSTGETTC